MSTLAGIFLPLHASVPILLFCRKVRLGMIDLSQRDVVSRLILCRVECGHRHDGKTSHFPPMIVCE